MSKSGGPPNESRAEATERSADTLRALALECEETARSGMESMAIVFLFRTAKSMRDEARRISARVAAGEIDG
jgi:hypothetical protein